MGRAFRTPGNFAASGKYLTVNNIAMFHDYFSYLSMYNHNIAESYSTIEIITDESL